MTDSAFTADFEFKPTRNWVAFEISNVRDGFAVLRGLIHDLRDMEDIDQNTIRRMIWAADHVKAELEEACEHADALEDEERAEVAARRSALPQAAE